MDSGGLVYVTALLMLSVFCVCVTACGSCTGSVQYCVDAISWSHPGVSRRVGFV